MTVTHVGFQQFNVSFIQSCNLSKKYFPRLATNRFYSDEFGHTVPDILTLDFFLLFFWPNLAHIVTQMIWHFVLSRSKCSQNSQTLDRISKFHRFSYQAIKLNLYLWMQNSIWCLNLFRFFVRSVSVTITKQNFIYTAKTSMLNNDRREVGSHNWDVIRQFLSSALPSVSISAFGEIFFLARKFIKIQSLYIFKLDKAILSWLYWHV